MPRGDKFCYTCDSDEQHRPLTGPEKTWLKQHTSRKNVEGFFMCKAPDCRNVRTGFDKRPFDPVVRIPLPD
ncbi:hypothetical protein OG782_35025 [Streptomyces sp. NBC_00876]|uniref:hypothetical protein n=1 Tax=Streptomyces sp. NBC_00876 TaxID=2975853 RepID=UPI003862EE4E|nr:hypothetical protein OG782_35025 [Streptomyces sp. NBC_00876]